MEIDTNESVSSNPVFKQENDKKNIETWREFENSEVLILEGHSAEVFVSSWNPQKDHILATGSGDATARIWNVNTLNCMVLKHYLSDERTAGCGVTTIDWDPSGKYLATGSQNGKARIWDEEGLKNCFFMLKIRPNRSLFKWS